MAEPLVELPQDAALQPEASSTISLESVSQEPQAIEETHRDVSALNKSDDAQSCMDRISESASLCSGFVKKLDESNHPPTTSEKSSSNPPIVNISASQVTEGHDVETSLDCDNSVSSDHKDGNMQQEVVTKVSGDVSGNAESQQNINGVDLPGIFAPEHFGNSGDRTRSMSEGSSGSEDECRRMEISHLDSDTGSSSVSPRDQASSEVSSDDPLADLESLRQCTSSVMSDVSSYSWMREGTMGSMISVDPDSALGRIRADIAAAGSADWKSQPGTVLTGQDKGAGDVKPTAQLTNKLVKGPTVTLPPSKPFVSKPLTLTPAAGTQEPQTPVRKYSTHQTQDGSEANSNASCQQKVSQSDPSPVPESQSPDTSTEAKPPQVATESQASTSTEAANSASLAKTRVKRTPNDFIFGKVIGEGSYSTVYLAKEVSTQREFAIKICEKKHLIRERKTHFVMREKEVFMKLDHPFFVKLAYTFQDSERLYYVLTYARNGELLGYLHKLSVFDIPCTRFYTAEVILALEYLHGLGIIHRDLKPENILLGDDMHIRITDFGTSKILQLDENGKPVNSAEQKKKNSFVGTAEYVSPEVLNNEPANFGSDFWALGCIIYQCLSGSMPFRSGNEYQTFQKIVKAEYTFPEGFNAEAKDLVSKLLVLDPEERLGMPNTGGMSALKSHKFYAGLDWDTLPSSSPPKLMPYLPATSHNPEFWGQDHLVGFDDQRLAEIITGQSNADGSLSPELEEVPVRGASPIDCAVDKDDPEVIREERLEKQRRENQFHQYVQGNLILKQGFVDKRKGLFARKRMLLLTEGPHLYYVDAHHKVLKGEIPWSRYLRPEAKSFKIFFVHTPNRTYYLESRMPDAQMWVKKIKEVSRKYYGSTQEEQN
ncbi:hypothetical protein EGW08_019497 [Elysia chlorotica]|uniref:3-phosphoinositide-dependent protein kinase 1 n=1 Tax=Elysia chlorotica TaxID=188477 RepID=A0A433STY8_ELYCH|nr:hypothetical protein EGW08_019497 [Elysia chlorotica]